MYTPQPAVIIMGLMGIICLFALADAYLVASDWLIDCLPECQKGDPAPLRNLPRISKYYLPDEWSHLLVENILTAVNISTPHDALLPRFQINTNEVIKMIFICHAQVIQYEIPSPNAETCLSFHFNSTFLLGFAFGFFFLFFVSAFGFSASLGGLLGLSPSLGLDCCDLEVCVTYEIEISEFLIFLFCLFVAVRRSSSQMIDKQAAVYWVWNWANLRRLG